MGLKTALRTSGVLWLAPLVLGMSWHLTHFDSRRLPPYWAGNTALAALCVAMYGPACAALAARQAGRLRRAGLPGLAPVRSRYATALNALWPVAALGVAAVGVSLVTVRIDTGSAHDWPHLGVLALCGALIAAHTVAGYAAGWVLPRLLAPPLVLVADYLWIVLPNTIVDPMWPRHLTGMLDGPVGNFALTTHPVALWAPGILAVGVALAVVLGGEAARLPVLARSRLPRFGAAAAVGAIVVAACGAFASAPVRGWDGDPPPYARSDAPVCTGSAPRVCVPADFGGDLGTITEAADSVVDRLAEAGVPRPRQISYVTADPADRRADTWYHFLRPGADRTEAERAIAMAAAPPLDCRGYVGSGSALEAWLLLTTGTDRDTVARMVLRQDLLLLDDLVLPLSRAEQGLWFTETSASLRKCRYTADADADKYLYDPSPGGRS
ncbi:DUF7224 domain-containing protein [Streptomyces sp. BBFR102]|uniref:DUF7224 domain-containing protein n=1 Tax=Streptomyces sp. BBFR102 TaxID=3448171 RepID=UPI003F52DD53